jgi:uncharacterized protein with HEPN domain
VEALERKIPELQRTVGVRNRIVHGYDVIRNEALWDIERNEVPALRGQIERV